MSKEVLVLNVASDALAKKTEWLVKRDELLVESKPLQSVDDQESLNASGKLQKAISKHVKELKDERLSLTRQIDAVKKDIMAQEKDMVNALNSELERLKAMNNEYATRLAAEAEQKRLEEEAKRRAEAEKQFEQEQQVQSAFGSGGQFVERDLPTEVYIPPVETKPKADGLSFVEKWDFRIIDSAKIPREFLAVDESKIRQYVKAMKEGASIPGVEVFKTMASRTR